MATIKIERGFTHRIQDKGYVHSPTIPQPKPPPKKPGGGAKWVLPAAAGGVVLLVVIVLAVVFAKKSKEAPAAQPAQPPQQAAAAKPAEPETVEPTEPDETMKLYEQTPTPKYQPNVQSQPADPRPILREVPLGSAQGLLCEYYEKIPDKQLKNLRAAPAFPNRPSRTVQIPRFDLSENVANEYGARVRGYLVPPKSGTYTFTLCVDDAGEFSLSTDDTPGNLRRLITVNSWAKDWNTRPEQRSAPCELVAGQRYYLEAIMKEGTGLDFMRVGWSGPVSEKTTVIDAPFLQPWSDEPTQAQPAAAAAEGSSAAALAEKRRRRAELEAALAPALAALAEQQRANGAAYRYAEAAAALKADTTAWQPQAKALIDGAVERFELLAKLRAFVQSELARARVKGVWTAFGGQADVTGATDEGVTVAPGRIVAWAKIPPEQMLRLINATVPQASADAATRATLCLAAAVYCKTVSGGIELALKYRERAVALNATLVPVADRVLGGTPEAVAAEPRIAAARAELSRLADASTRLTEGTAKLQSELASATRLVAGLNVSYWEKVMYGSLSDVRKNKVLEATPSATRRLTEFATPEGYGERFVARVWGFLTPPETSDYLFYIAADDQGEFWLGEDENPATLALCVKTDMHTQSRAWDKDNRKSRPMALVKDRRYCVEAFLREGEKGDHLAVAWSLASENKPELITLEHLACQPQFDLPPRARELRTQAEDGLKQCRALTDEILAWREKVALDAEELASAATSQQAVDLQAQVTRAKAMLRDLEKLQQQVAAALPQLKTALQPEK